MAQDWFEIFILNLRIILYQMVQKHLTQIIYINDVVEVVVV